MACSKLEAMAIYLVKQACGNDKRACVYFIHIFKGKSTLCNVIAGKPPNDQLFPTGTDPEGITATTLLQNITFLGDGRTHISLIDAIGFDDAYESVDGIFQMDLVSKLKCSCDHVNLFAITINGQLPIFDNSLKAMLQLLEVSTY